MKTFNDLQFKPHPIGDGLAAKLFFPNNYGISVVRFQLPMFGGYGSYTDNEQEWEIAILRGVEHNWDIAHDTPISEGDGVLGHLTAEDVTEIMHKIQQL